MSKKERRKKGIHNIKEERTEELNKGRKEYY
jgi:hypothetical protein